MSWVKIDDQLAFHPKIMDAGNAAVGGWLRMLAWSAQHLTDGRIPHRIAYTICTNAEVTALLTARLLKSSGDDYVIHDFLEWNRSAEEIRAKKGQTKKRVEEWRLRNRNAVTPSVTNGVTGVVTNAVCTPAPSPSPSPIEEYIAPPSDTAAASPSWQFDLGQIYAAYPRKKGRSAGYKSLARKVRTPETFDRVLKAVKLFADECKRKGTEDKFIPYFSTWVNEQRWDDYETAKPAAETTSLFAELCKRESEANK